MTLRRIIFGLILLTVAVFCLVAARKLTATPKYDRIEGDITFPEAYELLGASELEVSKHDAEGVQYLVRGEWEVDEGRITLILCGEDGGRPIFRKQLVRRGPLERLAWLLGWRPKPEPVPPPPPMIGKGFVE